MPYVAYVELVILIPSSYHHQPQLRRDGMQAAALLSLEQITVDACSHSFNGCRQPFTVELNHQLSTTPSLPGFRIILGVPVAQSSTRPANSNASNHRVWFVQACATQQTKACRGRTVRGKPYSFSHQTQCKWTAGPERVHISLVGCEAKYEVHLYYVGDTRSPFAHHDPVLL